VRSLWRRIRILWGNLTGRDLAIRDLFDPDDMVDRWVFMLSATVADLATIESAFRDALDGESAPMAHTLYMHRQLGVRMVEAWRVVGEIRDHPEIEQFVEVAGAKASADWLRERFTRTSNEQSEVERVFRHDRDRAVHHAWVNSSELRDTLNVAGKQTARIVRDHARQSATIEFPEVSISRYMFGDPGKPAGKSALLERAELAQDSFAHFKELWEAALAAQGARRGVDLSRLYHEVGDTGN
jgi:hypothetical protein